MLLQCHRVRFQSTVARSQGAFASFELERSPRCLLASNDGPGDLQHLLEEKTFTSMPLGCPLSYLFDTSGHEASNEVVIAGHLRLGDAHMTGGGDSHDRGRAVLVDKTWGFGTPEIAGTQFLYCLLGLSRRLVHSGGTDGKKCVVKLMSDSQHAKDAALKVAKALPRDESSCEVHVAPGVAKHSATQKGHDVADAVANDFLALATADYVLLTHSGFGTSAASMGASQRGQAYRIEESYLKPFSETPASKPANLFADKLSFQDFCFSTLPTPISPTI